MRPVPEISIPDDQMSEIDSSTEDVHDHIEQEKIEDPKYDDEVNLLESVRKEETEINLLESVLSIREMKGFSCLIDDLKTQSDGAYSLTNEKIHKLAEELRSLPSQTVRVYSRLSQRLVMLLGTYYRYVQLIDIPIEDLKTLLEYSPWGDLLEVVEKYENFYRFHQLTSAQISYLSGVMLQDVSSEFHEKYHRENVDRLAKMTARDQLLFCQKVHKRILSGIATTSFLNKSVELSEHMGNTTDSVGDKIVDYYPFDVVYYLDEDKKIYGFVRTEFEYILEKRENPYNRRKIPLSVLVEIEKKENISKIFSLGKCQTIENTWKSLLNPVLKYEDLLPRVLQLIQKPYEVKMPVFRHNEYPSSILRTMADYYEQTDLPMLQPENILEEEYRPRIRGPSHSRSSSIHSRVDNTIPIEHAPRDNHRSNYRTTTYDRDETTISPVSDVYSSNAYYAPNYSYGYRRGPQGRTSQIYHRSSEYRSPGRREEVIPVNTNSTNSQDLHHGVVTPEAVAGLLFGSGTI